MFHYLLHHFNCHDGLGTKIMTKTIDINFISNNVKGIQNFLKRHKNFLIIQKKTYIIMTLYFFKKLTLQVKMK